MPGASSPGVGKSLIRQIQIWALVAGAALFVGVFLILRHFTDWSLSVRMGSELSIFFIWSLGRSFLGRIGAYRKLRTAKLLLALPVGLFSLAAFANASPQTSAYAPWIIAGTILFHFGVTKRYIRSVRHDVQVDESTRK
jgi:hypothetical protein